MARRAFTLIELVVAIGLSTFILLMAFSALRMATTAFKTVSRFTTENDLLRRGTLLAYDAADFWNDMADPDFPWAKQPSSFQNVDYAGAKSATTPDPAADPLEYDRKINNANNKRNFRLVNFSATGYYNPNTFLAHDPRSWYRNHLMTSPRPTCFDGGNGNIYWPNALYGGGAFSGNWNMQSSDIPPGWQARHVWGDYSLNANTGMDPASDIRGHRPRYMVSLYADLGMAGTLSYLPPGHPYTIQMPSTNQADFAAALTANPDPPASGSRNLWKFWHNLGELPGQLQPQDSVGSSGTYQSTRNWWRVRGMTVWPNWLDNTPITSDGSNPPPKTDTWLPNGLTDTALGINRRNMHRTVLFEGMTRNVDDSSSWRKGPHVSDLSFLTWDRYFVWGSNMYRYINNTGTSAWSAQRLNAVSRGGFAGTMGRTNNTDVASIQQTLPRDFGTTVFMLPRARANEDFADTGASDRFSRPAGMPIVSLSLLRYGFRSGEFCQATLRLVDPDSGRIVTFSTYPIGTTFRGARQHWALRTGGSGAYAPTMGDVYQ